MGVSVSKIHATDEERHRNKQVEQILANEKRKDDKIFKMLLLGAGDSGKSTIIKQMKILHADGFDEEETRAQRTLIAANVVHSICDILRAMTKLGIKLGNSDRESDAERILKLEAEWIQRPQTVDLADWMCLQRLWEDEGVQKCFERSSEYQLSDSTKYFCDNIERVSARDYVPNEQDILRTRSATQGIVEMFFTIRNLTLKVIDVGGQRSQRKKWIHCFDNVNALIFVASLSEYNQVLLEDAGVNRMLESLKLFFTVINSPWFVKASVVLFLNKRDLFAEKIHHYPLSDLFHDYTGGPNYETASEFIKDLYEKQRKDPDKAIYTHKTCATETRNVEFVLESCFDILLRNSLARSGLL